MGLNLLDIINIFIFYVHIILNIKNIHSKVIINNFFLYNIKYSKHCSKVIINNSSRPNAQYN